MEGRYGLIADIGLTQVEHVKLEAEGMPYLIRYGRSGLRGGQA
jgi:hypothetical protein